MALTPEQRKVLRAFTRASKDLGATRKPTKALIEAGLAESGLRNLNYGDRDSLGPLQQRPSQGWKNARDPYLAAVDFLKQAVPLKGKYGSAGQLAQAVQRSAFPARYDQNSSQANALLKGVSAGKPSYGSAPVAPATTSDAKTQIALSLLGMGNMGYGGEGDSLTNSLIAAAGKKVRLGIPSGPEPSTGDIVGIVQKAKQIDKERLPYQWGGGHGAKPAGPGVPLDCSGAVSRLLGVTPRVSGDFTKYGKPGKGQSLTIYANGKHVLMEIKGHFWGTSASNPQGGAGWIPRSQISEQYLKGFTARHPAGM